MVRLIEPKLKDISALLSEMGVLSQRALGLAVESFVNNRPLEHETFTLAEQLRTLHYRVMDLSTEAIARYQPVATDLRFIRACGEVSYGLYRTGRYAYDIVGTVSVFGDLRGCSWEDVIRTSGVVKEMLTQAIEAFSNLDEKLALEVIGLDDVVDGEYRRYLRKVIEGGGERRCEIAGLLIMRYLERMADHANAIAEATLYVIRGS
ncbi:MAG: phosphate uptake regulator PhoU [Nitrososphaerota archaeon]|nr:phosphate uptake regulator PhoU [Candidatus Calditenuis fumarioli]